MYALPHRAPLARSELTILGETRYRTSKERFGLLAPDRLRHLWILGKTGSGKSNLLASLMAQDLHNGAGFALLDPHGDLVRQVLALVPRCRTNEVLLLEPEDQAHPVAWNIFRQGRALHPDPATLAAALVTTFKRFWADSWGPRLEHILRNAVMAVAPDARATLLFLYRFLVDEALREAVVEHTTDPVVRLFWTKEFPSYGAKLQAEALAPVLNKLGAFLAYPAIRGMLGIERSRVNFAEFMENRRVILASLATGAIGADASHLLGGLLLTSLQLAAMSRPRGGPPFIVYVDEFQNFVTDALATLLAESRKFGLGLVLAHQYVGQLPERIRSAVLGNVGSMVLFRLGAEDADVLEPEVAPEFAAHDLQSLGAYETIVRVIARGVALRPFSACTLRAPEPPADADARSNAVRSQSRLRYSTRPS